MSSKPGERADNDIQSGALSQQMFLPGSMLDTSKETLQRLTLPPRSQMTFTIFPRLPLELRLKIWHHAHDLFPRVIEIVPIETDGAASPSSSVTAMSIPVLLSVCKESRLELLRLYTAPFNPTFVTRATVDRSPENLILCWKMDTLQYS